MDTKAVFKAIRNDPEELGKLLAQDASAVLSLRNTNDNTPLMAAAAHGSPASLKLLLEAQADPNDANKAGVTPLMRACSRGGSKSMELSGDVIDLLIKAKANIHAIDQDNQCSLILATATGKPTLVQKLLDATADLSTKSKDGESPLELALKNGHDQVAGLLKGATLARESVDQKIASERATEARKKAEILEEQAQMAAQIGEPAEADTEESETATCTEPEREAAEAAEAASPATTDRPVVDQNAARVAAARVHRLQRIFDGLDIERAGTVGLSSAAAVLGNKWGGDLIRDIDKDKKGGVSKQEFVLYILRSVRTTQGFNQGCDHLESKILNFQKQAQQQATTESNVETIQRDSTQRVSQSADERQHCCANNCSVM